MQTFLFYDLETTGLNKAFDQILQFAAIRTDMSFREIDRHCEAYLAPLAGEYPIFISADHGLPIAGTRLLREWRKTHRCRSLRTHRAE